MSHENLFADIEQDNNPSFYGNPSILQDPYGHPSHSPATTTTTATQQASHPQTNGQVNDGFPTELVNSTLGISQKISEFLNDEDLQIEIVNSERLVNSHVIVYTIQLSSTNNKNKIIVKRRYSEFKSLRDNLLRLYPTLIIPPIPEKHSILNYVLNSIKSTNEVNIIEMRRRYFKMFLYDLIFDTSLKNCILLHKFLDPNYELGWYNALNEPPVNRIPDNLLLANPIDPSDQNGLYSLLPIVNGFDFNSNIDNLPNLKKMNDDLLKLNDQVKLYELRGFEQDFEFSIPEDLIKFELKFHQIIKILTDLNKLDVRTSKDFKILIHILIDLGSNLNNFSLQIYNQKTPNQLSESIEKFGSTIDQSFLNFESFISNHLIPEWQEPIHQLIQYYYTALNLIKFYKYKIIQYKILYKLKFNKFQQLVNLSNIAGTPAPPPTASSANNTDTQNGQAELEPNIDHLQQLNSPTLNNALKNLSQKKKLTKQTSWYGLFGGNNPPKKFNFKLPEQQQEVPPPPSSSSTSSSHSLRFKLNQIEKELNKLNQLIELCNNDMSILTKTLSNTFEEFLVKLEKKWLNLMINYIKNGKHLFEENLLNWQEFKQGLISGTTEIT
ncbi:Sorting nexin-41 [Spathaspora sp. JA1]|nr:Sorting nexin-41 [Spathaspora sp. JA1]